MKEERSICGNCKWSRQDVPFGDFTCHNQQSDCYGCECMYDDSCEEFQGSEE